MPDTTVYVPVGDKAMLQKFPSSVLSVCLFGSRCPRLLIFHSIYFKQKEEAVGPLVALQFPNKLEFSIDHSTGRTHGLFSHQGTARIPINNLVISEVFAAVGCRPSQLPGSSQLEARPVLASFGGCCSG